MSFTINSQEPIHDNKHIIIGNYYFSPKHRGQSTRAARISTWKCSIKEEYDLMNDSINKMFYVQDNNLFHSYNLIKGLPILGENDIHPKLRIAKFVESVPNLWHGYPADHISNNQDRPETTILAEMNKIGLITPSLMRKISKGQKI